MISSLYIEEEIWDHPRSQAIRDRFPRARIITCQRYTEIFNRHGQNFRLQKQHPALILAKKSNRLVIPTPTGYGIGGERNFYFSHMLNCIYDCRYCFLQGLYRSANYVLFVNFEDFQEAIVKETARSEGSSYFFSGYDCDSFALESITGFVRAFLPFFTNNPSAYLELRTKSLAATSLLKEKAPANIILAFSLTPSALSRTYEHGVPPLEKRVSLIAKLAEAGWLIGLRFDPLIHHEDYQENYRALFDQIFSMIARDTVHSVSFGALRFPKGMHERMHRLYPKEALLTTNLQEEGNMVSHPGGIETEMTRFCQDELSQHVSPERLFHCPNQ